MPLVRRTLTRKFILAGAGMLLGAVVAAALIIANVLFIRSEVVYLTEHTIEQVRLGGAFNTSIFRSITEAESFTRNRNPVDRAEALAELHDARIILDQLASDTTVFDAADVDIQLAQTELHQQRVAILTAVEPRVVQILRAAETDNITAITSALADLSAVESSIEATEERFGDVMGQSIEDARATSTRVMHQAIVTTAGLVSLIALAVLGLLLFIRQTIVLPVTQLVAVTRTMAEGDIDHLITVTSTDEIGDLQTAFNYMVTKRTQVEAELREERALLSQRVVERTAELSTANAELARAARLKDEFLASMSHKLRTPLNAILGLSEALQEHIYGDLTPRQHKTIGTIRESGTHLLAMITDILDLSKIGAGKMTLTIEPIDLRNVMQASQRLVSQIADQKHLRVFSSLDSTVGVFQADARCLKQILVNLLSNAVKFTPDGGMIGLDIVGDSAERVVACTVWDTGIGIPADAQVLLFQPFVQIDSGLARQYEGTGLGLALVAQMAELHGAVSP